ncbi:MAG: 2-hydroxyacyl-CoA dehydratase [Chloroflexi bacterium]|nr:2-hydroxyacyl-CoA dehydratase [Chloroflexota bacterium]
MSALDELKGIAGTLTNPSLQEWKSEGRKVIGFLCAYVPEEIIHAAGILPYRVRAVGCDQTSSADVYMSQVNCTFSRSCLEFALEDKYSFLDGLVFVWSCDNLRRVYDILREIRPDTFPLLHFIDVPHKTTDAAIDRFTEELESFKQALEQTYGVEITDDKLKEAISVYNETRSLLRQLYDLRQSKNPPLTGAEALSVVLAGTVIPKQQYNQLLKKLLEELREREGISDYRARLVIAGGGGCDDPEYFQIMEDLGGLIVNDTICFGSRTFMEPVKVDDDPMAALARSYLNRPSCPRMPEKLAERTNSIKEMVEKSQADGVVFQRLRYCDLWGGEQLDITRKMKEANIPLLTLEREYRTSATGQLKTRIQAFLERLEV